MARNDLSAKIDAEVLTQAKIVATHRRITLAEYLTELLREPVAGDYKEALRQMASGIQPPSAPKRPKAKGE